MEIRTVIYVDSEKGGHLKAYEPLDYTNITLKDGYCSKPYVLFISLRKALESLGIKTKDFIYGGYKRGVRRYLLTVSDKDAGKLDQLNSHLSSINLKLVDSKDKPDRKIRSHRLKIAWRRFKTGSLLASFNSIIYDIIIILIEIVVIVYNIVAIATSNNDKAIYLVMLAVVFAILADSVKKVISPLWYTLKNRSGLYFVKDGDRQVARTKEIVKKVSVNKTERYSKFDTFAFDKGLKRIKINDKTPLLDTYEYFITSDEINRSLDSIVTQAKIKMTHKSKPKDYHKYLSVLVKARQKEGRVVYQGTPEVGLCTDITSSDITTIKIAKVKYFTYMASDDMVFQTIRSSYDPNYELDGSKFSMTKDGTLRNMEHGIITNLIGINLIIKIDNQYLVSVQNSLNDVNCGRLVPSSSGSMDFNDIEKSLKYARKDHNFKWLLYTAMRRELIEELGLTLRKDKLPEEFTVVGYIRLVSKGGKPDFFALLDLKNTTVKRDLPFIFDSDIENNSSLDLKGKIVRQYARHQNQVLEEGKDAVESDMIKFMTYSELCVSTNYKPSLQLSYIVDTIERSKNK